MGVSVCLSICPSVSVWCVCVLNKLTFNFTCHALARQYARTSAIGLSLYPLFGMWGRIFEALLLVPGATIRTGPLKHLQVPFFCCAITRLLIPGAAILASPLQHLQVPS